MTYHCPLLYGKGQNIELEIIALHIEINQNYATHTLGNEGG